MTLLAPVSPKAQLSFVPLSPTTSLMKDTNVQQGSALLVSTNSPKQVALSIKIKKILTIHIEEKRCTPHFDVFPTERLRTNWCESGAPIGVWQSW